jgi:hypothetical protein
LANADRGQYRDWKRLANANRGQLRLAEAG